MHNDLQWYKSGIVRTGTAFWLKSSTPKCSAPSGRCKTSFKIWISLKPPQQKHVLHWRISPTEIKGNPVKLPNRHNYLYEWLKNKLWLSNLKSTFSHQSLGKYLNQGKWWFINVFMFMYVLHWRISPTEIKGNQWSFPNKYNYSYEWFKNKFWMSNLKSTFSHQS